MCVCGFIIAVILRLTASRNEQAELRFDRFREGSRKERVSELRGVSEMKDVSEHVFDIMPASFGHRGFFARLAPIKGFGMQDLLNA